MAPRLQGSSVAVAGDPHISYSRGVESTMPLLGCQDLERILSQYGREETAYLAVRVGSQVYGTATPESDTDFMVVGDFSKPEILFGHDFNVTLKSVGGFTESLRNQSVYALEALFAPPEHRFWDARDFTWKLDLGKLRAKTEAKSDSDWKKGLKLLASEPEKARKKLFHALRVPEFARQLATVGRIEHFDSANDWFEEIMTEPSEDHSQYESAWGDLRRELLNDIV